MTNHELTATDDLNYALHLIDKLPNTLLEHVAHLGDVRQRLEELDERTCTGRTHWRDKDKPGKAAKLYILHGTNQVCPIHGKPKPDGRIRVYIGNKPDKMSDAQAAIERETARQNLQQDLHRLHGKINYTIHQVKAVYRVLGRTPPAPGQDVPPLWSKPSPMATK